MNDVVMILAARILKTIFCGNRAVSCYITIDNASYAIIMKLYFYWFNFNDW